MTACRAISLSIAEDRTLQSAFMRLSDLHVQPLNQVEVDVIWRALTLLQSDVVLTSSQVFRLSNAAAVLERRVRARSATG